MSALLWLILTVAWAANPRHVLEPVKTPAAVLYLPPNEFRRRGLLR